MQLRDFYIISNRWIAGDAVKVRYGDKKIAMLSNLVDDEIDFSVQVAKTEHDEEFKRQQFIMEHLPYIDICCLEFYKSETLPDVFEEVLAGIVKRKEESCKERQLRAIDFLRGASALVKQKIDDIGLEVEAEVYRAYKERKYWARQQAKLAREAQTVMQAFAETKDVDKDASEEERDEHFKAVLNLHHFTDMLTKIGKIKKPDVVLQQWTTEDIKEEAKRNYYFDMFAELIREETSALHGAEDKVPIMTGPSMDSDDEDLAIPNENDNDGDNKETTNKKEKETDKLAEVLEQMRKDDLQDNNNTGDMDDNVANTDNINTTNEINDTPDEADTNQDNTITNERNEGNTIITTEEKVDESKECCSDSATGTTDEKPCKSETEEDDSFVSALELRMYERRQEATLARFHTECNAVLKQAYDTIQTAPTEIVSKLMELERSPDVPDNSLKLAEEVPEIHQHDTNENKNTNITDGSLKRRKTKRATANTPPIDMSEYSEDITSKNDSIESIVDESVPSNNTGLPDKVDEADNPSNIIPTEKTDDITYHNNTSTEHIDVIDNVNNNASPERTETIDDVDNTIPNATDVFHTMGSNEITYNGVETNATIPSDVSNNNNLHDIEEKSKELKEKDQAKLVLQEIPVPISNKENILPK